jgi:LacI family transcriptional regulator
MARATIDDVAKLAGVSIKTVSRVVNNEPNVRESTRERVEKAIAALNYQPNQAARNLASLRSHLIALIYDDPSVYEVPSSGYIIRMQEGALKACREAGYSLLIHPCRYRDRNAGAELTQLIEHTSPSGIVLAAPLSNVPRIVSAITSTGTPLVRLSPGRANRLRSSISTNDREISAEMTRYLASLGHRKIAFIQGNRGHKAVGNRFRGYLDGLEQSGLPFVEVFVCEGDNSIQSGEACATQLLQRQNRPTAIFAANDDMAAGALRVADRMGIAVPGELSIAGCDDIALAQQIYPALTTINQPLASMAERAVNLLIEAIRDHSEPEASEVIPATIKIRESTGKAPAS